MSVPAGFKGLRFPCECVSSMPGGYSDPWADHEEIGFCLPP
jgi:hypothetical protein